MKKWLLQAGALLVVLNLAAQEQLIEPARLLTRFNFRQLTGGVILLNARMDPFPDTLNFILDTGSGGISLDSAAADKFGLEGTPSDRIIRGIAGIRKVSFLYNRKLHLPGIEIDSLNFHINDYQILTSVYGIRIDGIIGYSVISRYILKVNYDSTIIEFWTHGDMDYPRGGFLLHPVINLLPIHTAQLRDDKRLDPRVLFDLGAGLNLMLTTDFLRDSGLLKKSRKMYAKQAEGVGGKVDMNVTVIRELKLGPYRFRQVPVYIFEDEFNITSYPYLGGILGSDILRRFNIILNYGRREIHLIPNSYFGDPFDYSYSGLEFYLEDSRVVLGDVAAGSPAEKAGLKEGDEVIAINNDFSKNLRHYKSAVQQIGERLNFIVLRDGKLMQFSFRVRSIR